MPDDLTIPPLLDARVSGDRFGIVIEWAVDGKPARTVAMTHRGAVELAEAIKRTVARHATIEIAEKLT